MIVSFRVSTDGCRYRVSTKTISGLLGLVFYDVRRRRRGKRLVKKVFIVILECQNCVDLFNTPIGL